MEETLHRETEQQLSHDKNAHETSAQGAQRHSHSDVTDGPDGHQCLQLCTRGSLLRRFATHTLIQTLSHRHTTAGGERAATPTHNLLCSLVRPRIPTHDCTSDAPTRRPHGCRFDNVPSFRRHVPQRTRGARRLPHQRPFRLNVSGTKCQSAPSPAMSPKSRCLTNAHCSPAW